MLKSQTCIGTHCHKDQIQNHSRDPCLFAVICLKGFLLKKNGIPFTYACGHTSMPWHVCGGQKTTLSRAGQFSAFTNFLLGNETQVIGCGSLHLHKEPPLWPLKALLLVKFNLVVWSHFLNQLHRFYVIPIFWNSTLYYCSPNHF